jgi:hypothetical protein
MEVKEFIESLVDDGLDNNTIINFVNDQENRLRDANRRSEYWKAEHLAANTEIESITDRKPSDLEIVQKAVIEKFGRAGCLVFHAKGWLAETDEYVIAEGSDNESLLTWAKQTIGSKD